MAKEDAELEVTLRNVAFETLRPLSVIVGLFLMWTALSDRAAYSGPYAAWPSWADVAAGAALSMTGAVSFVWRPAPRFVYPWALLVVAAVSTTSAIGMTVGGSVGAVPNIAFVAFGAALVILSLPWLAAALLIVVTAWSIVTFGFGIDGSGSPGFLFQLAVILSAVTGWGRIRGYRKIVEARLDSDKARARASRLNDELEHFASVVTHDLQTPLTALRLKASIARLALEHDNDESARKALLDIDRIASQSGVFVHEMLDYAKSGDHHLKMGPVDLNEVVRQVSELVEAPLISIGGRIEAKPLPPIQGDPVQMRQLVLNLLSNAIRYRRDEVPLVIKVSAVEDIGGVSVTVEDNGQGFKPEEAERLFLPFEMGEGGKGHGLGLATCKRIVDGHGGSIHAEGVPGRGAAFIFELPRQGTVVGPRSTTDSVQR